MCICAFNVNKPTGKNMYREFDECQIWMESWNILHAYSDTHSRTHWKKNRIVACKNSNQILPTQSKVIWCIECAGKISCCSGKVNAHRKITDIGPNNLRLEYRRVANQSCHWTHSYLGQTLMRLKK